MAQNAGGFVDRVNATTVAVHTLHYVLTLLKIIFLLITPAAQKIKHCLPAAQHWMDTSFVLTRYVTGVNHLPLFR